MQTDTLGSEQCRSLPSESSMHVTSHVANPFEMLVDPEAFLRAIEGSERLKNMQGRVCRPLDRQVPAKDEAPSQPNASPSAGAPGDDMDVPACGF